MSIDWKKVAFWIAMFLLCIGCGLLVLFVIAAFVAYAWTGFVKYMRRE